VRRSGPNELQAGGRLVYNHHLVERDGVFKWFNGLFGECGQRKGPSSSPGTGEHRLESPQWLLGKKWPVVGRAKIF